MPIIGPGYDDPEYDNYDPAWKRQNTPFRAWLYEKLTAARFPCAADIAIGYAPANRYHGLDDLEMGTIAMITGASFDEVRTAHKADIAAWMREQELHDHPDLAVADADLNRIAERH
ncbi:hypothetical protein ACH4GK_17755 [Streptomyces rimosus]|uniref:hypothetical protein n=1 Tax=Streptomyces rimosus TaxID=1927 RepID=UPI0004C48CF2|nr:hypothetical protein [Streptomyces rimosus]